MIVSIFLLFEILGVLSAIHAVMNVRTPQGTIAWIVSLITVPVVAVPAYWVFGRSKFQGYVLASEQGVSYTDYSSVFRPLQYREYTAIYSVV